MWTGRELYRYQNDNFRNTYYYDSEGLRSRKNIYIKNANGGFDYNGKVMYQYLGGLLTYQCTYNASDEVDKEMYFFYDSYDRLTAIRYISSIGDYYYYVTTNKQGDVLGLYSANGNLKVSYEYDAWGNCTVKDASGNAITSTVHIGNVNPIRYRSYYYDTDTGMYYLQSRYYDATIGRFINADGTLNGNGDIIGFNMYAYCSNNPVMFKDLEGKGFLGKLLDRVYHNLKYTFDQLIVAPMKSVTASVGFGPGIGAGFEGQIDGVNIGAEYKDADIASLELSKGKIQGKFSSGESVSLNLEILEYQNFDGIGHCFSDAECTCGGFNAGFFGMLCCPANKEVTGNSQVLGVSASLYVGFGGEASLGLDLNTWLEEKHRIEEEFDNYCESWTWDE